MKLLFTGTVPIWLVLPAILLAMAFTLAVYRRHALPPPWRYVLPACRILALALLLMTLLQPVLARIWTTETRGRIPVLIDNSGSMSIPEHYSPAVQVEVAWHLGLYPRNLRNTAARGMSSQCHELANLAADLAARVEQATRALNVEDELTEQEDTAVRNLGRQADKLEERVREFSAKLGKGVSQGRYLALSADPAERRGHILYERFDGVEGWEVNNLTQAAKFPDHPDFSRKLTGFSAPGRGGDSYGARLYGLLHPPETGTYRFQISADDQAELFLSENDAPAGKRRIARAPGWTEPGVYDASPEQQSEAISLEKGKAYFIEVIHKENLGDEHCSVAWILPDGTREAPIPGSAASPLADTQALHSFRTELRQLQDEFAGTQASLQAIAQASELLRGDAPVGERRAAYARLKATASLVADQWMAMSPRLLKLQTMADETLAVAGVGAVDEALDALATMSRTQMACQLLRDGDVDIQRLRRIGDVDIVSLNEPVKLYPFTEGDPAELPVPGSVLNSTRLGSVLRDVANLHGNQPVSAILLLSDGNSNSGKSLAEVRQLLDERDVPVFGIGIGLTVPPDDIAVERVLAPKTSFKGDRIVVTVVLRRHGFETRPVTVTVKAGDELRAEAVVVPGESPVVNVELSFVEDQEGIRHYQVEAEHMASEILDTNNRRMLSVTVLRDPIQALLVDEFPRWESRYANMMLKRDPRIEVKSLFVASLANEESFHDAGGFPVAVDELFAYQLLILGDVNPDHFSENQLEMVRAFVVEKGGTLILMAGESYMPDGYRNTPLAELFPFRAQPPPVRVALDLPVADDAAENPFLKLKLTESGRFENPVQIGVTPERSQSLWRQLPGMNWVKPGVFPVQHAEILAVTEEDEQPVVVTALVGLGKVMYVGTDSLWRWRYRARWTYHHRLWGQLLLWATVGRTSGTDEHVKLMTDRPEYSPGETVVLKARVIGVDRKPLEQATVSAQIFSEQEEPVKSVRFQHLPNSGGEYRAQVRDLPKGRYRVVPQVQELAGVDIAADYPFEIRDLPTSEYIELALDETAMKTVCTEYRSLTDAGELLDLIPKITRQEEHRRDTELWDSLWLLALIAGLLGFEWHMRKRQHLV